LLLACGEEGMNRIVSWGLPICNYFRDKYYLPPKGGECTSNKGEGSGSADMLRLHRIYPYEPQKVISPAKAEAALAENLKGMKTKKARLEYARKMLVDLDLVR
jgi:hypothetical protein